MTTDQAELVTTLRKWANYARNGSMNENPAQTPTGFDMEEVVEFSTGNFTRREYVPYKKFRASLSNNPELRAEFDDRRDRTRAAFAPVENGDADERDLARLADALDTEADYIERLDLQGGRDALCGTLERIEKAQGEMADALIKQGVTLDRIDANTRQRKPTRGDYEVTQPDAAQILTEVGYKVSARQIQNWDRYLKTKGDKGTCPPDGYKTELRAELLTFKRWAETAASHKRMKNALRQRRQRAHKTNA